MDYQELFNKYKNKLGLLLIAVLVVGFWVVTDEKISDVQQDVAGMYSPLRPYLPEETQAKVDALFEQWEEIAPTVESLETWIDEQGDDTAITYGYQTLIHGDGPDKLVAESGGEIEVKSGGTLDLQTGSTNTFAGTVNFSGATVTNLEMSGGTINGVLLVDGQTDVVQATIQGMATQTANMLVVETSAGTDVAAFKVPPAAAGSFDLLDLTATMVIQDGSDVVQGIDINLTGADHTGSNTIDGINIGLTTADAQATESALAFSDNWDQDINGTTDMVMSVDNVTVATWADPPAAGASGDTLDLTVILGIMDGSDAYVGVDYNLTGANHTGATNTVTGFDLGLTTPDPQSVETGLKITDADWDYAIDTGPVPIWSSAQTLFADFLGDTIPAEHVGLIGTDPQGAAPALAQEQYGVVTLVSGDDGANCAADCSELAWGLHWQADQGSLVFEVRLHIDTALTNAIVCAGLTDLLTLEMPATINGSDVVTTNADDMLAFCYDTTSATDEWFALGSAGGTDATGNGATGTAPVFDVYQVLRIEADAAGADARFYIDGTLVKTLTANAITITDPLTPVVVVDTNAAANITVDVDYFGVSAQRQ